MNDPTPSPPPAAVRALLERLIRAGAVLPGDVRAAVLALDRTVSIPALVEILESDALARADAPGRGHAPVHAVELLRELEAAGAIEPMLRVLARQDPVELLANELILALQALGAPVLEPALAAHARAATDEQRMGVEEVLSALGVRDERILAILRKALERQPGFAAGLLASYGDPAALPALLAALDLVRERYPRDADDLLELAAAVEELGGELTAEQQQAVAAAVAALRAAGGPAQRAEAELEGEEDEEEDDEYGDEGVEDAEERDRILDRFEASAYAAAAPVHDWIARMLEYATEYVGVPFADLDGGVLDEIVFEIIPRKVSCSPDVAEEVVRSLRAFWQFARDELSHPYAEECLKLLGDGATARLERELSDPANFGLAKSFFMGSGGPELPWRLEAGAQRPAGSRAARKQKKQARKQRKKAQRRNRR